MSSRKCGPTHGAGAWNTFCAMSLWLSWSSPMQHSTTCCEFSPTMPFEERYSRPPPSEVSRRGESGQTAIAQYQYAGSHEGLAYGAEANAPTSGARFGPRRRLTHEPPFREQALSESDSP